MINYTSAEKVIPTLPSSILRNEDKTKILSWVYKGFQELNLPQNNQVKCCIYTVKNHKAQLCSDVRSIVSVTKYNENISPFSLEPYLSTMEDGELERDCVGNYTLNSELFLASYDYKNSFLPLKYIGNSAYVSSKCCNLFAHNCNDTYSITPDRYINTSNKEGQFCVVYNSHVRDSFGNLMILDLPEVINYLRSYVIYSHLEDRVLTEERMIGVSDREFQKMNNLYKKARGKAILMSTNYKTLAELTTESFNAILLKHAGR